VAKVTEVKAASLVLDYNLYPRHKVDSTHVLHLRSALRAGEKLPPVVADEASRRVVDGFHRVVSHLQEHGDEATIRVEFRKYESEADLIEDAIRLNSGHGSNLTPWDRVRCTILAEEYGLAVGRLAAALRAPLAEVEDLRLRRTVKVGRDATISPIKRGFSHLAKKGKVTKRQMEGMETAGGLQRTYYVNEVIRTLEYDLADWENPKFVDRLKVLKAMLNEIDLDSYLKAAS